jgi:hypothetical protein
LIGLIVLCSPAEPKGEYHSPVSESTTHNGGGLKKVLEGLVKEDNSQKEENQKKQRRSYSKIYFSFIYQNSLNN